MFKSLGGKLAKGCAVALAAASLLGCTLMFSGCESKNPEISVNIEFNGEEYSLTYKLHRDLYSQTVAHYIELIDKDFFDGTVVHDFQSNRMVAGGYTYTDLENGDVLDDLTALDYDGATKDADGNVTLENITVWKDADRNEATNRLHGETSVNGFSVSEGGLNNKFGVLGTYSYVPTGEKTNVTFKQSSKDDYGHSEYYKNSTTSMFYIYTSTSSSTDRNYCVFGELADDESKQVLEDLLDAIDDYQSDNELDSFTEEHEVTIRDEFVSGGSYEATFDVPAAKVVITSVEVNKY